MKIYLSSRAGNSEAMVQRITTRLRQEFMEGLENQLMNLYQARTVVPAKRTMKAGETIEDTLRSATARSDAMLVLIGPDWATVTDSEGNKRLDDPQDPVRLEIELAMEQDKTRIIPVLLDGARMPDADDLPDSLKPLTEQEALMVRPDPDYRADMAQLVGMLKGAYDKGDSSFVTYMAALGAFLLIAFIIIAIAQVGG